MNRFVGLGVFALISSAFLGLACDDSTTPPVTSSPGAGGAQNSTTKKTSAAENGGDDGGGGEDATGGTSAKKTSATKASTAKGGTSSSSAKKTTTAAKPEGGAGGEDTEPAATGGKSGGGGESTAECTPGTTNLLTDAAKSKEFNWVGGDNTIDTDDPCGFQGAFYAYSDAGADEVQGNADDSLQSPAFVTGTEYASPCVEGKCCISGKTNLWPAEKVYTTWGAGLGFSLSDAGEGAGKRAYAGSARGFKIMLDGKIAKQAIRIGLTQSADDKSAPFVTTTSLGEKTVMFSDPTCPSWATDCIDPTDAPYDLQIQVAGGDTGADGDFEVCVTSLIPIE
ncbi:MAG: hypothetical protein ACM3ZE_00175 [Myxococcales bacterium]